MKNEAQDNVLLVMVGIGTLPLSGTYLYFQGLYTSMLNTFSSLERIKDKWIGKYKKEKRFEENKKRK